MRDSLRGEKLVVSLLKGPNERLGKRVGVRLRERVGVRLRERCGEKCYVFLFGILGYI